MELKNLSDDDILELLDCYFKIFTTMDLCKVKTHESLKNHLNKLYNELKSEYTKREKQKLINILL